MKNVKLTVGIVATVLSLMIPDAMAQGQGPNPDAINIESPFKGVVFNMNPTGLTVRGELNPPNPPANKTSGSSKIKSENRSVHFAIKGARITRGGWRPCELKDLQRGDSVTVTFMAPKQGSSKFAATQVDIAKTELSAADKLPILGKPGKLLFEDDFSRSAMPPKWRLGKGFWEIHDGVVAAAENPDDHHGAYAYAEPRFPYKDIVAEFSFKFDGSTGCHLMMEDSNYKGAHAGHIIRATVTPTSAQLADSKFGTMKNEIYEKNKDPNTSPEEKKQIQESIKDKAASFKIALDPGKWHQARVEVVGDEMLISIDNQPVGYLKSEGVTHPTKNMVGFTVAGKSTQLDNVKVWDATVRSDWSRNRSDVLAVLRKQ
ncbi:MAG: hypothetical protein NT105_06380 [Verrucomicrobia bacterium]|nr:hypothetical protein [Verrucomicrobiota bacterium]